jgi:putative ABC transport system permease protein
VKTVQVARIAVNGLWTNRMRSGLTMLGVVIGVTAVVSLLSIGEGTQATITSKIEAMGTNLIYVRPGSTSQSGVSQGAGSAATLTLEDGEAIAQQIPTVAAVVPQTSSTAQVVAGRNNTRTQILGVTEEYAPMRDWEVDQGDFITMSDLENRNTVVVLGSIAAASLFPGGNAVVNRSRLITIRIP